MLVNVYVTDVWRCVICNAKTLGLQHLQFLGVGASSGPRDRACV
jgi:hypothetical protein